MINPNIRSLLDPNVAPIATLILEWLDRGYSEQFMRYLLDVRLRAARLGATRGVVRWRYIQQANVALIEDVLDAMEEKRMVAA